MATDLIRYDLLVQEALKGVVRRVLDDAKRDGLPGEHYFYITFRTKAAGVRLSDRMRERYPDEMTIVLQHQFWDLQVTDHGFEVGLSFSGVPERLLIPFDALTGFFDPSVPFSVKFEVQDKDAVVDGEDHTGAPKLGRPTAVPSLPAQAAPPVPLPRKASANEADKPKRAPEPARPEPSKPNPAGPEPAEAAQADSAANVISIDSFRKKP